MNITSAQYATDTVSGNNMAIQAIIDGEQISVPLAPGNRHYDEIMRLVESGELTIADAD